MVAARDGDPAALERLLRRHHDRVHAVCRRLAGNDADALDATQEALLAIVRGLHRFDGRAAFSTWAYRVATNACLDELRRRSRRPVPTPVADDALGAVRAGRSTGGDAFGDSVGESVADRLDLDGALATLSPEFRAAVVLRDVAGLDYAAIAEALDIPPGTVRSRIARGRAAVATALQPGEPAGNHDHRRERPTPQP
ncbi:RNA polymerase sigma factor SigE [soil metagenome]